MRGRPKEENPMRNQLKVRLTDKEFEYLHKEAESSGMTMSEIVRLALLNYYSSGRKK